MDAQSRWPECDRDFYSIDPITRVIRPSSWYGADLQTNNHRTYSWAGSQKASIDRYLTYLEGQPGFWTKEYVEWATSFPADWKIEFSWSGYCVGEWTYNSYQAPPKLPKPPLAKVPSTLPKWEKDRLSVIEAGIKYAVDRYGWQPVYNTAPASGPAYTPYERRDLKVR